MKHLFLASALVAVAALLALNGCSEPVPVAKSPAPDDAVKVASRKPMAPDNADSPESKVTAKGIDSEKTVGRESKSGIAVPVDSGDKGTVTSKPNKSAKKEGPSSDASPEPDVASKAPSLDKKSTTAKKKFKLEFVSASGEEGLNPGDTIPNIEGKDVDGIKFELSDYQGKVVMLDFWGDW